MSKTDHKFEQYPDGAFEGDVYLPAPGVATAVNAAIALGRPLLVAGEPGCGKTALAYSVAKRLGLGEPLRFNAHAESRWQDFLYSFDAVRRLYDAQVAEKGSGVPAQNYVKLTALGKAISERSRSVILLDEVDKAPRDFTNGLLPVFEGDLRFTIAETGTSFEWDVAPEKRPIIIITSNQERVLPDPFLRRCVFQYLEFPTAEELEAIVRRHLGESGIKGHADLVRHAADRLAALRATHGAEFEKNPGTSELIDWVRVLIADARETSGDDFANRHLFVLFKTKRDLDLVVGS